MAENEWGVVGEEPMSQDWSVESESQLSGDWAIESETPASANGYGFAKPEEESTPIQSALAGAAQATLGISESIWRTPEVANRFLDAVDQFGKRNLPDWMNSPVMANPLHYIEKGFDVGGQHFKGTSDLANDISKTSESLNQFEPFAKISAKGQKADQALKTLIDTGDVNALGDVLTDPDAWA
ncbi:MAG: hypothetical protein OEX07_07655, partial [Gammaproteobacteria bacterium]|nr:hypothetical protein [Gammaproteobacteria bacterium]